MVIEGKKIAARLEKALSREVKTLKKKRKSLHLAVFLVGESVEQTSFVRIKRQLAQHLGIAFEFVHLKNIPAFMDFIKSIKEKSCDKKVNGIIIQQPLPSHLQTDSIYDFINDEKEIEGHKHKSPFLPPLGLAVLTILKFVFGNQKITDDLFIKFPKDGSFFKRTFKNKKVVLIGRGVTGGKPIGQALSLAKINYFSINSTTPNPEEYYKSADVIITAVGKKIITPEILKPEVILINVGLHHDKGKLKGDYEEKEIKNIAAFYTPIIGGLGPIDVLYLYKNLIDAVKLQK
jgi:methylenetetrahydrofolate dehydrogenase (NADP+) / methenyltetrahydrofolate cyclohydrolase